MFRKLLTHLRLSTLPGGPSSTKIVYLSTGVGGILAATLMTWAFCWVYVSKGIADGGFAAALSALWATSYGFVTNAQNKKAEADKELTLNAEKK